MSQFGKKLGKGMLIVLLVNVFNMILNVVLNFIQPKYLPMSSYAAIKTFSLYLSATGIFHFGYLDGMFIRYGGRNIKDIEKQEFERNIATLRVFQAGVSLLVCIMGIIWGDLVLVIFSLLLLPYNMSMYFRLFYQAIGEFDLYGKIMNASTLILFILNVVFLFVLKQKDYFSYLIIYVVVYLIIWIVLERKMKINYGIHANILDFSLIELIESIKSGFVVMLGNFSTIFLTSMDRWYIKLFLSSVAFAEYSFAVSLESFLNVAVTPFTVTLYNFFCREKDILTIKRIHIAILIVSTLLVFLAFPAKFVLQIWLVDYMGSNSVLFYLFASQMFFIIIKSVYVNLYKAQRRQNVYFSRLFITLVVGFILNAIFLLILKSKEAMSIATLLTAMTWFILCQCDFKELRFNVRQYLYLICEMVTFLLLGNNCDAIVGGIIYLISTVVFLFVFLKKEIVYIINAIKDSIKEKTINIYGE